MEFSFSFIEAIVGSACESETDMLGLSAIDQAETGWPNQ
jgi:hypothetical protein